MGAPRNHIDGATQIPAAGRTQPIVSGLRLTRSRPDNVVSRIAFLHEAHAGPGKVLLCGLNIRPNLDDQFPEAVFLLDRLLRYVSGPEFRPSTELSDNELNVNCIPYGVNGRPPKAGGAAGVVPREGGCP